MNNLIELLKKNGINNTYAIPDTIMNEQIKILIFLFLFLSFIMVRKEIIPKINAIPFNTTTYNISPSVNKEEAKNTRITKNKNIIELKNFIHL